MRPEEPVHLVGGSGGVWRIGPEVHRPTGPWTPAVHELLNRLARAGLDGIPDVLGEDEQGREVLTFLEGETVDVDADQAPDQVLAEAAHWLRRFHDLSAQNPPDGPRRWRSSGPQPVSPAADQVICHHDTGAYNWIVRDGHFNGMIDWDQAGPGRPIDDLAFLCWSGIPLFRLVPVADAARRLRVAAEAYGRWDAQAVIDAVAARMTTACERIEAGIRRGDPGMLTLREVGEPERTRSRVDAFTARIPALREALR